MKLPGNHLMQSPSGKWVFVGSVRADLAYVRPDGTRPSDDEDWFTAYTPAQLEWCTSEDADDLRLEADYYESE